MQSNNGRRSPDRNVDDRFNREPSRGDVRWGADQDRNEGERGGRDRDEDQGWSSREREGGYGVSSTYRGQGRNDESWRDRVGVSHEDPREALRRRAGGEDRNFARNNQDPYGGGYENRGFENRGFENRGFEDRNASGGYRGSGGERDFPEDRSFGSSGENRPYGRGIGRTQGYGMGSGTGYGMGSRTGYGMNEQRSSGIGRIGGAVGSIGSSIGNSVEDRMFGHRGKGPVNFTRSDERIREMVCEVLADDDRIDASQIEIEVRNGEVTLSGAVEERQMKRLAEDAIENLPGVQDVHNHIRGPGLFGRGKERSTDDNVGQLNSLLRGEISAVETYRMALDKLDRGSQARGELETCVRSHEERVNVLREKVRQLGGSPATSSGPWGVFARLIEGGARALGDKAAIAALEEGEDHGLKDYRTALEKLDAEGRKLVQSRLLPAQEDTHARMSAYKRRLGSSGAAS